MSLCVAVQTEDSIILGADSRMSNYINGKHYKIHDHFQKIQIFGNSIAGYKLAFAGGNTNLVNAVFGEFRKQWFSYPSILQGIAKKYQDEFVKFCGEDYIKEKYFDKDGNLSTIGIILADTDSIYGISSYNNFEIEKHPTQKGRHNYFAFGIHSEQATPIMLKNKLLTLDDVVRAYREVFSTVASEEVGGILSIYILQDEGKKLGLLLQEPIPDSREIETIDIAQIQSMTTVNAVLTGKIQAGSVMSGSTVEGSEIKSSTITLDANNLLQGIRWVYDKDPSKKLAEIFTDTNSLNIEALGETINLYADAVNINADTINLNGEVDFTNASVKNFQVKFS